ncbi:MAG: hypothetical protein J0G33_04050 [Afipia felis]|nr:hypothetical protein [Afipia felis]
MLRRIFSAIVAGLGSIGRLAGAFVSAPFRAIDAMFGGGSDIPPASATSPESSDVRDPQRVEDLTKVYTSIAISIIEWCMASLVSNAPAPIPPKMPRGVSGWLPGLTQEECIVLASADITEVSSHIRGHDLMAGVRSVRPLDRIEWSPGPPLIYDDGPGSSFTDLADETTEPSSVARLAP